MTTLHSRKASALAEAPAAILLCASIAFVASCRNGENDYGTPAPDPTSAVVELLVLHDMLGKQPEERTEQSRKKEVNREKLADLFTDMVGRDRFLTDLYVGFVAGAIARNQKRLSVRTNGDKAEIAAGKATIVMRLADGRWRISLDESVPEEIKKLAAAEKARFDNALYYK